MRHSCRSLLARHQDALYLPGHGPLMREPRALVAELLSYRQAREASIFTQLDAGLSSISTIAERHYAT